MLRTGKTLKRVLQERYSATAINRETPVGTVSRRPP
jgi:hypothetical protein